MKYTIEFVDKKKNTPANLKSLKEFAEKNAGDGLKKIDYKKPRAKKGEMGEGLIESLTGLFTSVVGPLTKLAESLVVYVQNKKADIRLVGASGQEIIISHTFKTKDIDNLVKQFMAADEKLVKEGSKRSKKTPPEGPRE